MKYPEHYETLELPISATEKEIKSQYRRLAKRYHPDLHPNDKQAEEKFKKISEAYEVLGNAEKRDEYDKEWRRIRNEEEALQKKHSQVATVDETTIVYEDDIIVQNYKYRQQIKKYRLMLFSRMISMFLSLSILFAWLFFTGAKDLPELIENADKPFVEAAKYFDKAADEMTKVIDNINGYFVARSLVKAVKNGDQLEVIKNLNSRGNPNEIDTKNGYSLLMLSSNDNITNILIGYGANVNYIASDGKTPLYVAIERNDLNMAKSLIQAGSNVNYTDKITNYSLLMNTNDIKMYYLLLQNGANPNYVTPDGLSALRLAIAEQNMKKVKALREYGAKVDWYHVSMDK